MHANVVVDYAVVDNVVDVGMVVFELIFVGTSDN